MLALLNKLTKSKKLARSTTADTVANMAALLNAAIDITKLASTGDWVSETVGVCLPHVHDGANL
jgi:hypothetical protein